MFEFVESLNNGKLSPECRLLNKNLFYLCIQKDFVSDTQKFGI